jgi:biopolymer transport protein ExbD/biopolymer transport protein TolR
MVVTIDKDQNVYLQASGADKQINLNDLATLLSPAGTNPNPAKRVVYVRADERVPFGAFANVMESVKRAGITNISIVTQPFEKK